MKRAHGIPSIFRDDHLVGNALKSGPEFSILQRQGQRQSLSSGDRGRDRDRRAEILPGDRGTLVAILPIVLGIAQPALSSGAFSFARPFLFAVPLVAFPIAFPVARGTRRGTRRSRCARQLHPHFRRRRRRRRRRRVDRREQPRMPRGGKGGSKNQERERERERERKREIARSMSPRSIASKRNSREKLALVPSRQGGRGEENLRESVASPSRVAWP